MIKQQLKEYQVLHNLIWVEKLLVDVSRLCRQNQGTSKFCYGEMDSKLEYWLKNYIYLKASV